MENNENKITIDEAVEQLQEVAERLSTDKHGVVNVAFALHLLLVSVSKAEHKRKEEALNDLRMFKENYCRVIDLSKIPCNTCLFKNGDMCLMNAFISDLERVVHDKVEKEAEKPACIMQQGVYGVD